MNPADAENIDIFANRNVYFSSRIWKMFFFFFFTSAARRGQNGIVIFVVQKYLFGRLSCVRAAFIFPSRIKIFLILIEQNIRFTVHIPT